MLVISCWLWGKAFKASDVVKLRNGFARNLRQEHRFICVTDEELPKDIETTIIKDPGFAKMKGCLCRLRMFDKYWQRDIGIKDGDRLVCCDLDTIITDECDALFDREEQFVIMQGGNTVNPNPYGGALMMLRAGAHNEVWEEFTLQAALAAPHHSFPDDQSWIHHKIPNAPAWQVGSSSGVYCFRKPGWPEDDELPTDARLVTFRGNNQPVKHKTLDWVKEHWR